MQKKKNNGKEMLTKKQIELVATHCHDSRKSVDDLSRAACDLRRAAHRWHTVQRSEIEQKNEALAELYVYAVRFTRSVDAAEGLCQNGEDTILT